MWTQLEGLFAFLTMEHAYSSTVEEVEDFFKVTSDEGLPVSQVEANRELYGANGEW